MHYAVIYSSETELKVAKKCKTRLSNSNPIQIRLSRIYKIHIHHKAENPPNLNPNPCPCSSLPPGNKAAILHVFLRGANMDVV